MAYPSPPPYSLYPSGGQSGLSEFPGYPINTAASPPRYFHIVSQMNGLVLAVEGRTGCAGSRVSTCYRKTTDNNDQLWYEDPSTGTIRSKTSSNCMEISGDGSTMVVNPYAAGNPNQQWMVVEDKIQCRHDRNKVLNIADEQRSPGARICASASCGAFSQSWTLEFVCLETSTRAFIIKSKMNGLVLSVEGGSGIPGSRVITAFQNYKGNNEDQLWYEDAATGTIRTKINHYCIEMAVQGITLVVNPYAAGNANQQWMVVGDTIQCSHDTHNVLEIATEQRTPGVLIRSAQPHGRPSQHWIFEHLSTGDTYVSSPCPVSATSMEAAYLEGYSSAGLLPEKPSGGSDICPFYIRSEMNGRVLDIGGCNRKPGAQVIMYDKKVADATNQLWYFDESSVIRSCLNDFALDPTGTATTMQPLIASNPNHQWLYDGKKIYNRTERNLVLDIRRKNKGNFADVIKYPYKASSNQHWALDYM